MKWHILSVKGNKKPVWSCPLLLLCLVWQMVGAVLTQDCSCHCIVGPVLVPAMHELVPQTSCRACEEPVWVTLTQLPLPPGLEPNHPWVLASLVCPWPPAQRLLWVLGWVKGSTAWNWLTLLVVLLLFVYSESKGRISPLNMCTFQGCLPVLWEEEGCKKSWCCVSLEKEKRNWVNPLLIFELNITIYCNWQRPGIVLFFVSSPEWNCYLL